jgi:hypothetical protein
LRKASAVISARNVETAASIRTAGSSVGAGVGVAVGTQPARRRLTKSIKDKSLPVKESENVIVFHLILEVARMIP